MHKKDVLFTHVFILFSLSYNVLTVVVL